MCVRKEGERMKASVIVHWPGKDTAARVDHAVKLASLASAMGFALSSTPCSEEVECANCENEAKKKAVSA